LIVSSESRGAPTIQSSDPGAGWTWSAIDTRAEAATEVKCQRKVNWRQALISWLIEFNKY
jgi:hypothetical protein